MTAFPTYVAYTEQITFLLFLKVADEFTKPPYSRPAAMGQFAAIAKGLKS